MRQIQSCTPFSSSSLLSFLTNKTDRPWLSFSSAALERTATPPMWPKEGAWALAHFAITDSSLCNNLHHYHRWSIIMISSLWSPPSFESSMKKPSPAPRSGQPVHRGGGEERRLATTLIFLEAIFRPYCLGNFGLLKETRPGVNCAGVCNPQATTV